jgi:PIN domain nuclease of toxin-antitoxin system
MTTDGLLFDTCAMIWLSQGEPVLDSAMAIIERARKAKAVLCVSPMSASEAGLLVSRDKLPAVRDPLRWFEDFLDAASVTVQPASTPILVASSFLPELVHEDPVDRILIATARSENLAIVTRDRAILAYGAAGHVKTVRC